MGFDLVTSFTTSDFISSNTNEPHPFGIYYWNLILGYIPYLHDIDKDTTHIPCLPTNICTPKVKVLRHLGAHLTIWLTIVHALYVRDYLYNVYINGSFLRILHVWHANSLHKLYNSLRKVSEDAIFYEKAHECPSSSTDANGYTNRNPNFTCWFSFFSSSYDIVSLFPTILGIHARRSIPTTYWSHLQRCIFIYYYLIVIVFLT